MSDVTIPGLIFTFLIAVGVFISFFVIMIIMTDSILDNNEAYIFSKQNCLESDDIWIRNDRSCYERINGSLIKLFNFNDARKIDHEWFMIKGDADTIELLTVTRYTK